MGGLAVREAIMWGTLAACITAVPLMLVSQSGERSGVAIHSGAPSLPPPEPMSTGSLAEPPKPMAWQDPAYERIDPETAQKASPVARTVVPTASLPIESQVTSSPKARPKRNPRPIDHMQWILP